MQIGCAAYQRPAVLAYSCSRDCSCKPWLTPPQGGGPGAVPAVPRQAPRLLRHAPPARARRQGEEALCLLHCSPCSNCILSLRMMAPITSDSLPALPRPSDPCGRGHAGRDLRVGRGRRARRHLPDQGASASLNRPTSPPTQPLKMRCRHLPDQGGCSSRHQRDEMQANSVRQRRAASLWCRRATAAGLTAAG